MAKQTKQLIEEAQSGLLEIERQLESAKVTRDKLSGQIRKAKEQLSKKRTDTKYPTKLVSSIVKQFIKDKLLYSLVLKEIDIATDTNPEFSHPAYLSALYRAANKNEIYKFFPKGTGWDIDMDIQIIFEEAAGDLSDWAEGVLAYRDELGVNEGEESKNSGQRATFYWVGKVFGTAKEARTIKGRIRGSGRLAPFWQILNNGSQPLLSDREDGSFNPIPASPTGFIEEAERKSESLFRAYFLPEKERWFAEIAELEVQIKDAESLRESYNADIAQLRPEAKANRRVYDSFGAKKQFVDQQKLQEAVRRLRAGEDFGTQTIELTKSNSSYRVRPTVRRLEGLI